MSSRPLALLLLLNPLGLLSACERRESPPAVIVAPAGEPGAPGTASPTGEAGTSGTNAVVIVAPPASAASV